MEPGGENHPMGQDVQEADAWADKEFAGHEVHTEQPEVEGQNVPAEHGVQLNDPGDEKNPLGQMEQEALALELLRKEPAGQGAQLFKVAS